MPITQSIDADVIVLGLDAAGLLACALLGRRGLRVVGLAPPVSSASGTIELDGRALRTLARAGLEPDRPAHTSGGGARSEAPARLRAHGASIEGALRAAAAATPAVVLRPDARVEEIREGDGTVAVSFTAPDGSDAATVRARWAIGSGHEAVRDRRSGRVLRTGESPGTPSSEPDDTVSAGFRDIADLVWRLELVLSRDASDQLIDDWAEGRGHLVASGDTHAGQPVPAGRVTFEDGTESLDTVVGARWLLLSLLDVDGWLSMEQWPRLTALGGIAHTIGPAGSDADILDLDGACLAWMAENGIEHVLVRPDLVVAATARDQTELRARFDDLVEQMTAARSSLAPGQL